MHGTKGQFKSITVAWLLHGDFTSLWCDCVAGAVWSGSHSDSIVRGGAYDGALGVIGAIAAMQALRDAGFKPAKPLEAVMFATEEASRFSVPCLGRCAPGA